MSKDKQAAILAYVFGHYDSRGGTVAIVVDKHDGRLEWAKREYEKAAGWSGDEGKHTTAGAGRTCDNLVADLIYPDGPANTDYMWPATIEAEEKSGWDRVMLERGEMYDIEDSSEWWMVTPDMKPEEQIAKWGAVRLRVITNRGGDNEEREKSSNMDEAPLIPEVTDDELAWCHPEWSDDAFSFLLIKPETQQPQTEKE